MSINDELIISDPRFMNGSPVIRGTHITVEQILRELARGMSVEQILKEHSLLTPEGIKAGLEFAAESVRFAHLSGNPKI